MLMVDKKKLISDGLTVKEVVKLRKVSIPKTHYQYQMLTQTVINIYKSVNLLEKPYTTVLASENMIYANHKNKVNVSELNDWMLLEAIHPSFYYPVFILDETLYTTLSKTKCDIKDVVVEKSFAEKGIIFLPKTSKYSVIVFSVKHSLDFPTEKLISVCFLSDQIGSRGVTTIHMSNITKDYIYENFDGILHNDFIDIDQLITNIFLYKQSIPAEKNIIYTTSKYKQKGFGENAKKVIVPIVIGENYKPKFKNNNNEKGTHKSPITHWRSGHWRQQPFGSRDNSEFKTIWIEPTLVNF